MTIKFDFSHSPDIAWNSRLSDAKKARDVLESRQGAGKDFLGWLDLPGLISEQEIAAVENAAATIRKSDALVVIGIGGSYLGARALLEAIRSPFAENFPVFFAGHHLDPAYHKSLLDHLSKKTYSVNVISKSGTTTEPGLAFRLFWSDLSRRFDGEKLKHLVFATTDAKKGSLKKLSTAAGLTTFVIPDDVGGRFSVLTPVGLLPVAAAGLNVRKLIAGAKDMMEILRGKNRVSDEENPAIQYASYRNAAYSAGKKIEILVSYSPGLHFVSEWWKQLYGESEGKGGKGIFPASVDFTSDLHSMGQWIQEAERSIFETVIDVEKSADLKVPTAPNDDDGLKYLEGRPIQEINRTALQATLAAHRDGKVPCARMVLPAVDEYSLGMLMYMFEYGCGVSAYMLGVNPFDQPGVENYKNNMFRMLGKPGA